VRLVVRANDLRDGGVGKASAHDKTSGTPVTNFTCSNNKRSQ
jgi:hypothetical protein